MTHILCVSIEWRFSCVLLAFVFSLISLTPVLHVCMGTLDHYADSASSSDKSSSRCLLNTLRDWSHKNGYRERCECLWPRDQYIVVLNNCRSSEMIFVGSSDGLISCVGNGPIRRGFVQLFLFSLKRLIPSIWCMIYLYFG